ncbi:unnamed protein product [Cuscuta epithymum]|nr:unnamed protein product [Cuscuta epithymum]
MKRLSLTLRVQRMAVHKLFGCQMGSTAYM